MEAKCKNHFYKCSYFPIILAIIILDNDHNKYMLFSHFPPMQMDKSLAIQLAIELIHPVANVYL